MNVLVNGQTVFQRTMEIVQNGIITIKPINGRYAVKDGEKVIADTEYLYQAVDFIAGEMDRRLGLLDRYAAACNGINELTAPNDFKLLPLTYVQAFQDENEQRPFIYYVEAMENYLRIMQEVTVADEEYVFCVACESLELHNNKCECQRCGTINKK